VTIRPGAAWGAQVPSPSGLLAANSDAEFVRLAFGPGRPPVRLMDGDLARTVGVATGGRDRSDESQNDLVLELSVDVLDVATDVGEFVACAHVAARSPWRRGGWWRGPVVVAMNAQFMGRWDVAPRGHPNDGRTEVFEIVDALTIRDRLAVRRRLPLGTHVPHPAIGSRSVREAAFEFDGPMALLVDGRDVGTVRSMAVRVRPDAVDAYA
jgi:YegS C-terminal NAD kinase beta sandwich-like domain